MNTTRFVKSFSKGQITIPKEFREFFGIGDEFWLKLEIDKGKLIVEPITPKNDPSVRQAYRERLLSIKSDWFDEQDYKKVRQEVEDHLKKNLI